MVADEAKLAIVFATTQLNSTQSWLGFIFLRNHTTNHTRTEPSVTFSQLQHNQTDQIQYATLFQPN